MLDAARSWARAIKEDAHAIYLAARDPRTPWFAKAIALAVAAYALSPIDLIPDFVPVLGYLDDLVIVPLGIVIAVRLIPAEVLTEHRAAARIAAARPTSYAGAYAIALAWAASIGLTVFLLWPYIAG